MSPPSFHFGRGVVPSFPVSHSSFLSFYFFLSSLFLPHRLSISPSIFCSTASINSLCCLPFKWTASILWRLASSFRQISTLLISKHQKMNSLRRGARWATELLKPSFEIKQSTVERARRACELWDLPMVHRARRQITSQSSPHGMPFAQPSRTSEYTYIPPKSIFRA
jgi:hypothetical protein